MRRARAMLRCVWLMALLGVVGLRLLCPPGWMPNPEARAGSWLVICTGHGPLSPNNDDDRGGRPGKDKSHQEQCAFSGLALVLAPIFGPTFVAAPAQAGPPTTWPSQSRVAWLDHWRAQSARAPPVMT